VIVCGVVVLSPGRLRPSVAVADSAHSGQSREVPGSAPWRRLLARGELHVGGAAGHNGMMYLGAGLAGGYALARRVSNEGRKEVELALLGSARALGESPLIADSEDPRTHNTYHIALLLRASARLRTIAVFAEFGPLAFRISDAAGLLSAPSDAPPAMNGPGASGALGFGRATARSLVMFGFSYSAQREDRHRIDETYRVWSHYLGVSIRYTRRFGR